ncbi:MAG: glucose-6-phosphate isomerase [Clostridiales bacterium]|nr:glucose-6-phosphate isomerase [Candidatus Cacconaster stercorequi]
MIQVNLPNIQQFMPLPYEAALAPRLHIAHNHLQKGDGAGGEFTGWVRLPENYDRAEFDRIKLAARRIQQNSEALVVIGIGGSYLGARGVIECLCSPNYNLKKKETPNIYFVGNGLDSRAMEEVMELLEGVDFSVNVISKSGTTTEPAVAFRFFRKLLEDRYGREEAARRIYATTDRQRGALKNLADEAGYETFVVPDDIGGRYSVLTAVGLLPIAVAGVDIDELMAGAASMMEVCGKDDMGANPAWQYAGARYELYRTGKKIELLASFAPCFRFMAEWWKQLYGESEGKENKGLFPASVEFTADLHSMGQYIQQGERHLFETVVRFAPDEHELVVPRDEKDGDGLNFLAGRSMDFIRQQAMDGTLLAHVEGGVPNIMLCLGSNCAFTMGEMIYFFEYACGLSGYLLDVNPFDQPGVEAYKKNMFALLGKPGYEELHRELAEKLH